MIKRVKQILKTKGPKQFGLFVFAFNCLITLLTIQWIWRFIQWLFLFKRRLVFQELLESQVNGFSQDLSIAAYTIAAFIFFKLIFNLKLPMGKTFYVFCIGALLSIYFLIATSDIFLLHYWGSRINTQALTYLKYPKEIIASFTGLIWLILACYFAGLFVLSRWIAKRICVNLSNQTKKSAAVHYIMLFAILFILGRGGISKVPVQIGDAQQSTKPGINLLATNTIWNAGFYLLLTDQYPDVDHFRKNKYNYITQIKPYWRQGDSVLTTFPNKPKNICIIIMEGVSADVSNFLLGEGPDCLSRCAKWMKKGNSTPHFYATGDRTNKGIVSILSGWPGNPWQGILHEPQRASRLPNLAQLMLDNKRDTRFYYGGDLRFANLKSYLKTGGFKHIIEQSALNDQEKKGSWGFHDEVVLNKLYRDLSQSSKPIFSVAMLSSSHEPYDIIDSDEDEVKKYYASVRYVDSCLDDFFTKVEGDKRLDSTLFIVTSDHGKYLQNERTHFGQRGFFRIPFWVWEKGVERSEIGGYFENRCFSQADLYNTIYELMSHELDPKAKFSRSLLRKDHPNNAAFHMYEVGGIINPDKMNWLSTQELSITSEMPFNQWDSAILTLESAIISEYFDMH